MRQKVVLIATVFMTVVLLQGCLWSLDAPEKEPLPMYDREDNEQDGIVVTIEGVKYKLYPKLKWAGQRSGDRFGYAGSKDHMLFYCVNDPSMDFIFIWDNEYQPYGELAQVLLYRTDKEIPAPSGKSVDKMEWSEIIRRGNKFDRKGNTINDQQLIQLLFDELESNQHTFCPNADEFLDYGISITCYSKQVPSAMYFIDFAYNDGKLVAGNYYDGYVEFSPEVLEQIVGHEIDFEELLSRGEE